MLNILASSFPWPQLIDHALDFGGRGARCFSAEEFQGVKVLSLLCLFSGFHDHTALYPHFDSLSRGQVGALWHES